MAFLDEIATYLVSESVVTAVGTDCFKSAMPANPDTCVTVYETGGRAPDLGFGVSTGTQYDRPALQVVSRAGAADYSTAHTTAQLAMQALAKVQGTTTLSGTTYYLIQPLQSPFSLGEDENGRPRVAFNAICFKDPS